MAASKTSHKLLIAISVISFLGIVLLIASFVMSRAREREVAGLDNSEKYVIDFSSMLGADWLVMDHVLKDVEDIAGWDPSIAGRTQLWTYNAQNDLAFVKHHIITYVDAEAARGRYFVQLPILVSLLGGRIPNPQFPYKEVVFPIDTNPRADNQYIACQGIETSETHCAGLFLYGSHIVYINTFPVRDSIRYLFEEDLIVIFTAIDERMTTES